MKNSLFRDQTEGNADFSGFITVEAAIVFPCFILTILAMIFVIQYNFLTQGFICDAIRKTDSLLIGESEKILPFNYELLGHKYKVDVNQGFGTIQFEFKTLNEKFVHAELQYAEYRRGSQTGIWELPQLERGNKIQQIFGRNLSAFFPVLTSFNEGVATDVLSLDLTSKTYQDQTAFVEYLKKEISQFAEKRDYEYKNTKILNRQIKEKIFILVIPESCITEKQRVWVNGVENFSKSLDVKFELVEYEKKIMAPEGGKE